jgi:hypothetical protein
VKAPSSRELICVDLRGMRAALVEQARARGVSPSEFLRAALADSLKSASCVVPAAPDNSSQACKARSRLSLRMSGEDRRAILASAREAGLTPGAFVAGLVAGVPVLTSGASQGEHLAALVASNAAMASLARNLGGLKSLFRQGSIEAAQEYRAMLDDVARKVRGHLQHVSAVLADLRPGRASTTAARSSGGQGV